MDSSVAIGGIFQARIKSAGFDAENANELHEATYDAAIRIENAYKVITEADLNANTLAQYLIKHPETEEPETIAARIGILTTPNFGGVLAGTPTLIKIPSPKVATFLANLDFYKGSIQAVYDKLRNPNTIYTYSTMTNLQKMLPEFLGGVDAQSGPAFTLFGQNGLHSGEVIYIRPGFWTDMAAGFGGRPGVIVHEWARLFLDISANEKDENTGTTKDVYMWDWVIQMLNKISTVKNENAVGSPTWSNVLSINYWVNQLAK